MYYCRAVFVLLLLTRICLAQDAEFSQFFANPLYLNPALTGTTELPRIAVSYRNQWPQKGPAFRTYSLSYDQLLSKTNAGLGFQLMRDQIFNSVIISHSASLSYSYHLQLGYNSFMTLGLQTGIVYKQFNIGDLVFPSGIDQLSGETSEWVSTVYNDETKLFPDFGVGAVGQHGETFWGASMHHLNRADEAVIEGDQKGRMPIKTTVHAGARLHRLHYGLLSRIFTLSPNVMYQQQGKFKQLNTGIYAIEKSFLFGGWFRNNLDIRPDAVIGIIGFSVERLQLGYSFDFTVSKLSNYSYGSHEFSLTIYPGQKNDITSHDKLQIPMF